MKSKIPDGFEIESLQEYEELKKKSHEKVQGKTFLTATLQTDSSKTVQQNQNL